MLRFMKFLWVINISRLIEWSSVIFPIAADFTIDEIMSYSIHCRGKFTIGVVIFSKNVAGWFVWHRKRLATNWTQPEHPLVVGCQFKRRLRNYQFPRDPIEPTGEFPANKFEWETDLDVFISANETVLYEQKLMNRNCNTIHRADTICDLIFFPLTARCTVFLPLLRTSATVSR
jgi:hypothetical protein